MSERRAVVGGAVAGDLGKGIAAWTGDMGMCRVLLAASCLREPSS